MDIKLIKELVEKAEQFGSAKYRVYLLKKENQTYQLLMKGEIMAHFVITGYEEGYLKENYARNDYQMKTVDSLHKFLTGQY